MAHLSTINPEGSPQVIGLDGGDLVSTHIRDNVKLKDTRPTPE